MRPRNIIAALVLMGISATLFVFNRRAGSSHGTALFSPTPRWTLDIGRVSVPLALGPKGTIYAFTDSGNLTAIDPRGKLRWSRSSGASGRIRVAPAVGTDGAVYLIVYSKLVIFNADGKRRADEVKNTAGLAEGLGLTEKRLYSECARGGACSWTMDADADPVWTIHEGQFFAAPLIQQDGTIVWGGNRLVAVSDAIPPLRWTFPNGGNLARDEEHRDSYVMSGGEPVHVQGLAAARDGTTYVSEDNGIVAIDATGRKRWEIAVPPAPRREPVVASDGTIYFASEDHHLHAVKPDGKKLWTVATKSAIGQPLLGSAGSIFFTDAKNLRAIDPEGHDRWSVVLDEDVWGSPTLASDGTLYVATIKGTLYAFPVGERLMRSPWPKFQANARNSGQASTE